MVITAFHLSTTANSPPTIAGPSRLFVTLFQEAVLNFNVTDDKDLTLIDVVAVNGLPTGADLRSSVEGNHLQYVFMWTPTDIENVSLVFMASDELEAASILEVQVELIRILTISTYAHSLCLVLPLLL